MTSGVKSGSNILDKQVKEDRNCEISNSGDLINNPSNISMHDYCICESGISKFDFYLQCNSCHSYMHGACWDNDASAQIFNLHPSHSGDTVRFTALFEHITGTKPPSFCSRRISKLRTGKIQPVLE